MGKGIFETAAFTPGMTAKRAIFEKHKRDVRINELAKTTRVLSKEEIKKKKDHEEYLKRKKHIEELGRLKSL